MIRLFALLAVVLATPNDALAAYASDIGYIQLSKRLGGVFPDGTPLDEAGRGVTVALVEAPTTSGAYSPGEADAAFAGKTVRLMSGASNVSGHAAATARRLYGNGISIVPGIDTIDIYDALDFLGLLNRGLAQPPTALGAPKVVSNSWVISSISGTAVPIGQQWLRRVDDLVDSQGITVVAATANGSPLPFLLAPAYNAITVGRSVGGGVGPVKIAEGPGRVKPDLVVTTTTDTPNTSLATPTVAAAAAFLWDAATHQGWGASDVTRAQEPVVIKSLLMAGAHKTQTWRKGADDAGLDDEVVPLDFHVGAGELAIDESYSILAAGWQPPGAVGTRGWDYGSVTVGGVHEYRIEVTEGASFTANLTWNRHVVAYDPNLDPMYLGDLTLALYLGTTLVTRSDSPVDNVEHLLAEGLAAGTYRLLVGSNASLGTTKERYGLAWQVSAPPLPGVPTELTVTPEGCASDVLQLTWTPPEERGVTGYMVYAYSPSSGLIAIDAGDVTTLRITPVEPGAEYWLWVQAYNTIGQYGAVAFPFLHATASGDEDRDGIADTCDNCTAVANNDQRDTNGDGYGNLCDPDLDDNGIVDLLDRQLFFQLYYLNDPDADFDGDGIVGAVDYHLLMSYLTLPPGPSGQIP